MGSTAGLNKGQRHSLVVSSGAENDWKPMHKPMKAHNSNFSLQGVEEAKI
jgi:hypothetical protein